MDSLIEISISMLPFVLLALAGGFVGIWVFRFFQKQKQVGRMKRGVDMEQKSFKVLEDMGFVILDYQPVLYSHLEVNGKKVSYKITPDFKVRRDGKVNYLEVKSGTSANEISYAPTRRQILEYAMAGGDGEVLFLDMEKREIFSIKFPYKKDRFKWQRDVWRAVAILSLLGYLLVLITLAGQSLLKLL